MEDNIKKFEGLLDRMQGLLDNAKKQGHIIVRVEDLENAFPELKESEDERIRKMIINHLTQERGSLSNEDTADAIKWLEKQGQETSWKPSKEEMDVLYSLAYITNQYDERKEIVITRLYQDLKREFFNGSSYENMFPTNTSIENDVRRRSTIQVLEYARSLDVYNQFGKADIDKNIAWLEKQGGKQQGKTALEAAKEEKVDNQNCVKPTDRVEPKFNFKVGQWIVATGKCVYIIAKIDGFNVTLVDTNGDEYVFDASSLDDAHEWSIQDAKDGDVLSYVTDEEDLWIMIYWSLYEPYEGHVHYHALLVNDNFSDKGTCCICINDLKPSTKEQRNLLFAKMKDAGYKWDAEKKELKMFEKQGKSMWRDEDEKNLNDLDVILFEYKDMSKENYWHIINWLKSLKQRMEE